MEILASSMTSFSKHCFTILSEWGAGIVFRMSQASISTTCSFLSSTSTVPAHFRTQKAVVQVSGEYCRCVVKLNIPVCVHEWTLRMDISLCIRWIMFRTGKPPPVDGSGYFNTLDKYRIHGIVFCLLLCFRIIYCEGKFTFFFISLLKTSTQHYVLDLLYLILQYASVRLSIGME